MYSQIDHSQSKTRETIKSEVNDKDAHDYVDIDQVEILWPLHSILNIYSGSSLLHITEQC